MRRLGYIKNEWPHQHVIRLPCQTVPMQEERLLLVSFSVMPVFQKYINKKLNALRLQVNE